MEHSYLDYFSVGSAVMEFRLAVTSTQYRTLVRNDWHRDTRPRMVRKARRLSIRSAN